MISSQQYFFDLPIGDVNASACAAVRLLYFGSELGFFGSGKANPVDLKQTAAMRVKLAHSSCKPLSEKYDYSLVFCRNELSKNVWKPGHRDKFADLVKMTRRVKLGDKPSLKATWHNLFALPGRRPVKMAKYEENIPQDHYVPLHYLKTLQSDFRAFLMQSEKEYPLVRNLFDSMNLKLANRRDVIHPSPQSPDIVIYTTQ